MFIEIFKITFREVEKVPPLCKGRWHAKRDGGIVKIKKFSIKQSLSRLRRQLPLHKGAFFTFIYTSSIFLTTTDLIKDTKAIHYNTCL